MSGNELAIRATGEIVNLDDPAQCAFALESIRDLEGELRIVKMRLSDAIAAEMSRRGTGKTLELGNGRKAVLSGGKAVTYDGRLLREDLLAAGMPPENVDQVVERVVTYKVSATMAKKAASVNADYRFAVDANSTEVEVPVRVDVRRASGV